MAGSDAFGGGVARRRLRPARRRHRARGLPDRSADRSRRYGCRLPRHDLALDRNVALKLLAPELAEDVRFRERFLRESRLAASLDHPAIIPIYDAGEVAGQLYIAMRLVEGTT